MNDFGSCYHVSLSWGCQAGTDERRGNILSQVAKTNFYNWPFYLT